MDSVVEQCKVKQLKLGSVIENCTIKKTK